MGHVIFVKEYFRDHQRDQDQDEDWEEDGFSAKARGGDFLKVGVVILQPGVEPLRGKPGKPLVERRRAGRGKGHDHIGAGLCADFRHITRTSKDAPWKLQKAWRTDENGYTLEEYLVP